MIASTGYRRTVALRSRVERGKEKREQAGFTIAESNEAKAIHRREVKPVRFLELPLWLCGWEQVKQS